MILKHNCAIAGLKITSSLNTPHEFVVFLKHCKTVRIKKLKGEINHSHNLSLSVTCSSGSNTMSDFGAQGLFSSIIYVYEHLRGAAMRTGHGVGHCWGFTSQLPGSGPQVGRGFVSCVWRSETLRLPLRRKGAENYLFSSTSI